MNKVMSRSRRMLVAFVAALGVVGSMFFAGTSPAVAGNMGQQIEIGSYHYWNVYRITGPNQSWRTVTTNYVWTSPTWGGQRYYSRLPGWWWQGNVKVETWNTMTGAYHSKTCWVPTNQWGDWAWCHYDW